MKRIVIKRFGFGEGTLAFNTTFEVSADTTNMFRRPLRESSNRYLARVGDPGASIVKAVLSLPGICSVTIESYEIRVEKGEAFDWVWEGIDLKAKILEAITAAFGEIDEVVDQTMPPATESDVK